MTAAVTPADIVDDEYQGLSGTFARACREADRERANPAVSAARPQSSAHINQAGNRLVAQIRRRATLARISRGTIRRRIAEDRAIHFMEKITMNTAVDRIIAISRGEKPKEERSNSGRRRQLNIQTAAALRTKTFAPLKYIVPGLIVEGLVILAGKPKVRKSWMALDVALATAAGRLCLGDRKPQQGAVLYLGLEDGERRMQRRIDKLLPTFGAEWPEAFHYATQWLRADQGGVEEIDRWCDENPTARLVVIDVLARFRAPANNRASAYAEDYAALAQLQELAIKRAIAVLVIHHTRKGESEDPVEEISGTLGLSGCADAFMVLKRTSSGAALTGRGRDTEDVDLAVQFNDATCRWTILGEAADIRRPDERTRVLTALDGLVDGMSPADLSVELGISSGSARVTLHRMAKAGEIKKSKYGKYVHPNLSVTPVTPSQQPKNESKINPITAESVTVTVTGGFKHAPSVTPDEYLGPPGDDPTDFLGDTYPAMPEFLKRGQ